MTVSYTPEEIEGDRLQYIASFRDDSETGEENPNWLEDVQAMAEPGTFGYHEALHSTSMILGMVDEHVMGKPAVVMDKEAFRLAHEAHTHLFNLYQHLALIHMKDDSDDAE